MKTSLHVCPFSATSALIILLAAVWGQSATGEPAGTPAASVDPASQVEAEWLTQEAMRHPLLPAGATKPQPAEPPLTFASHRSKLIDIIRKGHYDAQLSQAEFIRLVTWIDANGPYYGNYEGKKNLKWKGEPDFRPEPVCGD